MGLNGLTRERINKTTMGGCVSSLSAGDGGNDTKKLEELRRVKSETMDLQKENEELERQLTMMNGRGSNLQFLIEEKVPKN